MEAQANYMKIRSRMSLLYHNYKLWYNQDSTFHHVIQSKVYMKNEVRDVRNSSPLPKESGIEVTGCYKLRPQVIAAEIGCPSFDVFPGNECVVDRTLPTRPGPIGIYLNHPSIRLGCLAGSHGDVFKCVSVGRAAT